VVGNDSTRRGAFRANGLHRSTATPAALALLLIALTGCSKSRSVRPDELEPEMPDQGQGAAGASVPSFPDTGINASTLTVTGVRPSTGPFAAAIKSSCAGAASPTPRWCSSTATWCSPETRCCRIATRCW